MSADGPLLCNAPAVISRNSRNGDHVICIFRDLFLGYITRAMRVQLRSYKDIATGSHKLAERIETRSSEENKRPACEDYACCSAVILGVCDSVRFV
jgi:hypothetical protein